MTTDGVNSRELALEVLLAVEKEEEYCHVILSAVLEKDCAIKNMCITCYISQKDA